MRYLFAKKRNAMNERKRISHQKEEADECSHFWDHRITVVNSTPHAHRYPFVPKVATGLKEPLKVPEPEESETWPPAGVCSFPLTWCDTQCIAVAVPCRRRIGGSALSLSQALALKNPDLMPMARCRLSSWYYFEYSHCSSEGVRGAHCSNPQSMKHFLRSFCMFESVHYITLPGSAYSVGFWEEGDWGSWGCCL